RLLGEAPVGTADRRMHDGQPEAREQHQNEEQRPIEGQEHASQQGAQAFHGRSPCAGGGDSNRSLKSDSAGAAGTGDDARGGGRRSPSSGSLGRARGRDRKSTRLNSSHVKISYAVFCLKKKRKKNAETCW